MTSQTPSLREKTGEVLFRAHLACTKGKRHDLARYLLDPQRGSEALFVLAAQGALPSASRAVQNAWLQAAALYAKKGYRPATADRRSPKPTWGYPDQDIGWSLAKSASHRQGNFPEKIVHSLYRVPETPGLSPHLLTAAAVPGITIHWYRLAYDITLHSSRKSRPGVRERWLKNFINTPN